MNWKELYTKAYTPYSKHPKACLILGKSGKAYPGVRVENISFPLTIPAIQLASCLCLSNSDVPVSLIKNNEESLEQEEFWVKEFSMNVDIRSDLNKTKMVDLRHKETRSSMREELKEIAKSARTINSDFPVSSLLFCKNDEVYSGVNIEVSDWTKGLCAERLAIAKAIVNGNRKFEQMCLYTEKGEFSSPCGACRQVITEHLTRHKIYFYHKDGTQSSHFSDDLLPLHFTSNSLSN